MVCIGYVVHGLASIITLTICIYINCVIPVLCVSVGVTSAKEKYAYIKNIIQTGVNTVLKCTTKDLIA